MPREPVKSIEVAAPDRLLTPQEVCDRLGVTDRWLRRQVAEGQIEVVKARRLNRFRESYINDWIAENTRGTEAL